jgi:hypothetical protein
MNSKNELPFIEKFEIWDVGGDEELRKKSLKGIKIRKKNKELSHKLLINYLDYEKFVKIGK